MATIRQSEFIKRTLPTRVISGAGNVFANDYFYDLPASQAVLNDIIDIGILPALHTVSDVILIADDLDTNGTPLVALDVGIMSGNPGDTDTGRTCGNEIFAADTTARTGGVARAAKTAGLILKPTENDRSIGVKIQAAPATAATTGRIRLRVFFHAADQTYQY